MKICRNSQINGSKKWISYKEALGLWIISCNLNMRSLEQLMSSWRHDRGIYGECRKNDVIRHKMTSRRRIFTKRPENVSLIDITPVVIWSHLHVFYKSCAHFGILQIFLDFLKKIVISPFSASDICLIKSVWDKMNWWISVWRRRKGC